MNRRKQIRDHVLKLLQDANLNISVFNCRREAYQESELPCALVSIEHEENELFSQSGGEVKKISDLSIEIILPGSLGSEDRIDDLTKKIEELLFQDPSLNDLVNLCTLKNTEITSLRETELDLTLAKMNFEIAYFASITPGHQSLTPLHGIHLNLKARTS